MDHAHDAPEQEEVLAPDEAPTPLWLPLLGVSLLLLAVIAFAALQGPGGESAAEGSDQRAAEEGSAAKAAQPAAAEAQP